MERISPWREPREGDSTTQAERLEKSLASVAGDLAIVRNFLSEINRATGDSARQELLVGLSSQISSLKRKSEPPELLPIWQIASALEGLLHSNRSVEASPRRRMRLSALWLPRWNRGRLRLLFSPAFDLAPTDPLPSQELGRLRRMSLHDAKTR
jgi:hypothetical protein